MKLRLAHPFLAKALPSKRRLAGAFSLVELLVACGIFALLMVLLLSVVTQTSTLWRRSTQSMDTAKSARQAFDSLTRLLSQATLNTYWDYDFNAQGIPTRYRRNSDLHFLISEAGTNGFPGTKDTGQNLLFQALLGYTATPQSTSNIPRLLNQLGFYIEFNSDEAWTPSILRDRVPARYRYRLMQLLEPTEKFSLYEEGKLAPARMDFSRAAPIADNVLALILIPERSPAEEQANGPLVSELLYDTRLNAEVSPQPLSANQLPPFVRVTLIAIDEQSAQRLDKGTEAPPSELVALFLNRFKEKTEYETDLEAVEAGLKTLNLNYRIFSTSVALRESKWSEM